jgi:hypothetical protein
MAHAGEVDFGAGVQQVSNEDDLLAVAQVFLGWPWFGGDNEDEAAKREREAAASRAGGACGCGAARQPGTWAAVGFRVSHVCAVGECRAAADAASAACDPQAAAAAAAAPT